MKCIGAIKIMNGLDYFSNINTEVQAPYMDFSIFSPFT